MPADANRWGNQRPATNEQRPATSPVDPKWCQEDPKCCQHRTGSIESIKIVSRGSKQTQNQSQWTREALGGCHTFQIPFKFIGSLGSAIGSACGAIGSAGGALGSAGGAIGSAGGAIGCARGGIGSASSAIGRTTCIAPHAVHHLLCTTCSSRAPPAEHHLQQHRTKP